MRLCSAKDTSRIGITIVPKLSYQDRRNAAAISLEITHILSIYIPLFEMSP